MTLVRREALKSRSPAMVMRHGRLVRRDKPIEVANDEPPADEEPQFPIMKAGAATLIVILVISFLIPVSQRMGPIRLTPYLTVLTLAFLPMVVTWMMGKRTKVILPDILMLLFCLWAAAAVYLNQGMAGSVEAVGVHIITTFGAYLAGRLLVRDPQSMRLLARAAVVSLSLMLPFILFEAVTGWQPILRAAAMFGQPLADVDTGTRMGMHRTQGSFEHPILMGVFAASMVSIAFYSFRDSHFRILKWLATPVVVVTSVLSLSTGALLSINIQFGLMLWARILRVVKTRWKILSALLASAYIAIDLVSTKTPFHVFVNYATFSAQSSYNRILIWQFGTAEVGRNPFFGIGFGEWQRPGYMSNSMDNFWLVQAVRYGLPAFLLLAASFIIILWRMGKRDGPTAELDLLRRGAIFSLLATMVAISSVHLWNATYVWLMFLLGAVVWLGQPGNGDTEPTPVARRAQRRRASNAA